MKAIIDTSSLMALVRYYLPFDNNENLKSFFNTKISNKEILVLDGVYDEAKYLSKSTITKNLEFIADKINHTKTSDFFPNREFSHHLQNSFCDNEIIRLKGLTSTDIDVAKKTFLNSADGKIILYSYFNKNDTIIITEETKSANDGKVFKKLPVLSEIINVQCCNLPYFLKNHCQIKMSDFLL
jgi:hypothetical protein